MMREGYERMFEGETHDDLEAGWEPQRNLDSFCQSFYGYYVENGFWPMVLTRVTSLINLAFTICFSAFLFLFVDWAAVFRCGHEECKLIRPNVLDSFAFGEVLVVLYFSIFSLYWLWSAIQFLFVLQDTIKMSRFYSRRLKIPDEELPLLEWHEVLTRLVKVQQKVKLSLKKDLDPLDITNRILRKENYMISMVDTGVFSVEALPFGAHSGVFGKVLEWNLRWCILHSMFDNKFSVKRFLDPHASEDYTSNPSVHAGQEQLRNGTTRLRRRFVIMGVVNFVFMPFIAMFMVVYFILRHFEELHSKRSSLGPREWTCYSRWLLREYNELPHFFERRLRKGNEASMDYIYQFPMSATSIVAQCVAYISGAVVGVLLFLSLAGSKSILNVYLGNRSLIWYLAFFTAILAASRAMIPTVPDAYQPHEAMEEVIKHTHYCPPRWKGRFHEYKVRQEFGSMYKPTLFVFLGELLCVITTPFVLFFWLPEQAEAILRCVKEVTVDLNGVGDVCGPAAFDLESFSAKPSAYRKIVHGEELKQSRKFRKYAQHSQVIEEKESEKQEMVEQKSLEPFQSRQKLEKSFVTFICNHPNYITDKQGTRLLTALIKPIPGKSPSPTRVVENNKSVDRSIAMSQKDHKSPVITIEGPDGKAVSNTLTDSERMLNFSFSSFSQILGGVGDAGVTEGAVLLGENPGISGDSVTSPGVGRSRRKNQKYSSGQGQMASSRNFKHDVNLAADDEGREKLFRALERIYEDEKEETKSR